MTRHQGLLAQGLAALFLASTAQFAWAGAVYRCGSGPGMVYQDVPCKSGAARAEMLTHHNSKGAISISQPDRGPKVAILLPEREDIPVTRVIKWAYDPTGQPAWLTTDQAQVMIQSAIQSWRTCGVQPSFAGSGTSLPLNRQDGLTVFYWDSRNPKRGTTDWLMDAASGRVLHGADVRLGHKSSLSQPSMQSTLVHEVGHVLGLGHSQFTDSVMAPTYRGRDTPTAQDIRDCGSVQ